MREEGSLCPRTKGIRKKTAQGSKASDLAAGVVGGMEGVRAGLNEKKGGAEDTIKTEGRGTDPVPALSIFGVMRQKGKNGEFLKKYKCPKCFCCGNSLMKVIRKMRFLS
jgi:hypothetical protein